MQIETIETQQSQFAIVDNTVETQKFAEWFAQKIEQLRSRPASSDARYAFGANAGSV